MSCAPLPGGARFFLSLIAAAGLLIVPLVGGELTRPEPPPVRDFAAAPAYEVVDVRAGNVVVVQLAGEQRELRLIGTYVPHSGRVEDEAWPFVRRMLVGEFVYVEYEADWPLRDRDDRYWAYVFRVPDGLFVNLELVRQGYARLSAIAPFEHQELLRAYEVRARRSHKGVWAQPVTSQPSEKPAEAVATPKPSAPPVAEAAPQRTGDDVIVYVTAHGKKYHREDCSFLRKGAIPMSLKEARAKGYTPCSRCRPPE